MSWELPPEPSSQSPICSGVMALVSEAGRGVGKGDRLALGVDPSGVWAVERELNVESSAGRVMGGMSGIGF